MADQSSDRDVSHAVFGLSDTATRRTAPAEAPNQPQPPAGASPQYVYVQPPPPAPTPMGVKVLYVLAGVLVILAGLNFYIFSVMRQQFTDAFSKQTDQLNLLTRRLDSSDERYAQLKGQFQVTTEKLHLTEAELSRARTLATTIQKQQQAAVADLNKAIAEKASTEEVNRVQADSNAKIGSLSGDLAGTKKELSDALAGTKGELSGAIARTHDELVELAHRTDRDYFEFSLKRKGTRQKIGTIAVSLKKTNLKKNQFTITIAADDKVTERRDKSINEPLYFYVQGASSALELVVNKLGRDSITGYVSTPKGFFAGVPNVLTARPVS